MEFLKKNLDWIAVIIVFILLIISFPHEAKAQQACIFQGEDVKCLKPNLNFQESGVRIITNDLDDPGVVAKDAPIGSLYIQKGTGTLYQKMDDGLTINWLSNLPTTISSVKDSMNFVGFSSYGTNSKSVIRFDGFTKNSMGTCGTVKNNATTGLEVVVIAPCYFVGSTSFSQGGDRFLAGPTVNATATELSDNFVDIPSAKKLCITDVPGVFNDSKECTFGYVATIGDIIRVQGPRGQKYGQDDKIYFNLIAFPQSDSIKGAGGTATGTGDVVGPSISTDTEIPMFDGDTGKLITGSGITLDKISFDSGPPHLAGDVTIFANSIDGKLSTSSTNFKDLVTAKNLSGGIDRVVLSDDIFKGVKTTDYKFPIKIGDEGKILTSKSGSAQWAEPPKNASIAEWSLNPSVPYALDIMVIYERDVYRNISPLDPADATFLQQLGSGSWELVSPTDSSSALVTGGIVSKGPLSKQLTITSGIGMVVDPYSDVGVRTFRRIDFNGTILTSILPPNFAYYIVVDETVNPIIPKIMPGSPGINDLKDHILLAQGFTDGNGDILNVDTSAWSAYYLSSGLQNLIIAIGNMNSGGIIGPISGSLTMNRTAGAIHSIGSNPTDGKRINLSIYGATPLLNFIYSNSVTVGSAGSVTTAFNSNQYEPNGLGPVINVPTDKFTIQRFYIATDGMQFIQYGQTYYDSMKDAVAAVNTEPYIVNPMFTNNRMFIFNGYIISKQGLTDMDAGKAHVIIGNCGPTGCSGMSSSIAVPIGGDVFGPSVASDENIAVFDGNSGKVIKDSGKDIGRFNYTDTAHSINEVPFYANNVNGRLRSSSVIWSDIVTATATYVEPNRPIVSASNDKTTKATTYSIPTNIGSYGQVLTSIGTEAEWASPTVGAGTGDVIGPNGVVEGDIATYKDNTGKLLGVSGYNFKNVLTANKNAGSQDKVVLSADSLKGTKVTDYKFPVALGTSGKVLTSKNGAAIWENLPTGSGGGPSPDTVTQANDSTEANFVKLSNGANREIKDTGYKIPITVGTNGQVLTSSGTNAVWDRPFDGSLPENIIIPTRTDGFCDPLAIYGPNQITSPDPIFSTVKLGNMINIIGGAFVNIGQFEILDVIDDYNIYVSEIACSSATNVIYEIKELSKESYVRGPKTSDEGRPAIFKGTDGKVIMDSSGVRFKGNGEIDIGLNGTIYSGNLTNRAMFNSKLIKLNDSDNASQGQTSVTIGGSSKSVMGNYRINLPSELPLLGQVMVAREGTPTNSNIYELVWETPSSGGGTVDPKIVTQAATSTAANFVKLSNGTDRVIKDTGYKIPIAVGVTGEVLTASGTDVVWKGILTPPTCNPAERLTFNGKDYKCANNTYEAPLLNELDWNAAHIFYKEISATEVFSFKNNGNGKMIILVVKNISATDQQIDAPGMSWVKSIPILTIKPGAVNIYTMIGAGATIFVNVVEEFRPYP